MEQFTKRYIDNSMIDFLNKGVKWDIRVWDELVSRRYQKSIWLCLTDAWPSNCKCWGLYFRRIQIYIILADWKHASGSELATEYLCLDRLAKRKDPVIMGASGWASQCPRYCGSWLKQRRPRHQCMWRHLVGIQNYASSPRIFYWQCWKKQHDLWVCCRMLLTHALSSGLPLTEELSICMYSAVDDEFTTYLTTTAKLLHTLPYRCDTHLIITADVNENHAGSHGMRYQACMMALLPWDMTRGNPPQTEAGHSLYTQVQPVFSTVPINDWYSQEEHCIMIDRPRENSWNKGSFTHIKWRVSLLHCRRILLFMKRIGEEVYFHQQGVWLYRV